MEKFTKFARLAETEFSDLVISIHDLGHKLRIYLRDKSFIDFFYSTQTTIGRFSIHWERNHIDNTFFRLDNIPDKKWKQVKTFLIHFHFKKYNHIIIPPFETRSISLPNLLRKFLEFVKKYLTNHLKFYKLGFD